MRVVTAEAWGMCFGVRDALQVAAELERPREVTIHGELVHNETVLVQLESRGFRMQPEQTRSTPDTSAVMITAHGISDRERERLEAAGKRLVDTTCPLVRRVHEAAVAFRDAGRHVLVIGRPGHVEVLGIVEDLDTYDVINSVQEVRRYDSRQLGVVFQTTAPPQAAAEILESIRAHNRDADIEVAHTICQPTLDRQRAVEKLASEVDVVIVVGGRNSNNTRQLVDLCRSQGTPAYRVSAAEDLQADWFEGSVSVGVTAGTSTLDETVRAIQQRLKSLPAAQGTWSSAQWCRHFRRNQGALISIPWETVPELTREERERIATSVQIFQRGESGQGSHFLKCAARYAQRSGDLDYVAAVRGLIAEEQRHAGDLGRFLDLAGIGRIPRDFSDGAFRRIRKLAGLETIVAVLVAAEIIAKVYYDALRQATNCPALQRICSQIQRDELAHVRFQCERLQLLRRSNWRWIRGLKQFAHTAAFCAAVLAVWWGHSQVLKSGGYHRRRFWNRCLLEFTKSMRAAQHKCS